VGWSPYPSQTGVFRRLGSVALRLTGVGYAVEQTPHMETIQIVLDKALLQATDRAARRMKRNRSALVREALREHLKRLESVRMKEICAALRFSLGCHLSQP
jgi:Ribbon-helix-helix protein, copG family